MRNINPNRSINDPDYVEDMLWMHVVSVNQTIIATINNIHYIFPESWKSHIRSQMQINSNSKIYKWDMPDADNSLIASIINKKSIARGHM